MKKFISATVFMFAISMLTVFTMSNIKNTNAQTEPDPEQPVSYSTVDMIATKVGNQILVNADVVFQNHNEQSDLYMVLTVVKPDTNNDGWYQSVYQTMHAPFTVNANDLYIDQFTEQTSTLPSGDYLVKLDLYIAMPVFDEFGEPLSVSHVICNDIVEITL